jgi:hypothetical protein
MQSLSLKSAEGRKRRERKRERERERERIGAECRRLFVCVKL